MDSDQGIRWDVVATQRAKIASGEYDDPVIVEEIIRRCANAIIEDLDACPTGKEHGDQYRDLVGEGLCHLLSEEVDYSLAQKEVANPGGRIDLELPLKYESLAPGSLWNRWHQAYDVRSVVVEVKNLKGKSSIDDFRQLQSYIKTANRGRMGFLVSRNGFTKMALQFAKSILVSAESTLMVPLSGLELSGLLRLTRDGRGAISTALRRKETMLLQFS